MIFNNKSIETYVSPICRSIAVKVEGVLCGSFGEKGSAGNGFGDGNTNDYDTDF